MEFDISRFRETFFQEADEHLGEMEAGLLLLERDHDPELLNAIFRGAHSIKGASGTFGFEAVSRFTHAMESLLDRMRSGAVSPSVERIGLLLESLDTLRRLLDSARTGAETPPEAGRAAESLLAAQGDVAREGGSRAATPTPVGPRDGTQNHWHVRFAPAADILRQGMDPVLILRDLARLGEVLKVESDLSRLPELDGLQADCCYLSWSVDLASDATEAQIREAFAFVEDGATIEMQREPASSGEASAVESPAGRGRVPPAAESGTIRVSTGKVDKLIDLVGELIIAQSMASQVLAAFQPKDLARLQENFAEVERYTRELQERLMGVRMLPIGNAFSRFPRLVRDLASATGKQVELRIEGEETELDKSVVERMADPLTHLVRNAIDHGIEPAAERVAGKVSHRNDPPAGSPSGRQRSPGSLR